MTFLALHPWVSQYTTFLFFHYITFKYKQFFKEFHLICWICDASKGLYVVFSNAHVGMYIRMYIGIDCFHFDGKQWFCFENEKEKNNKRNDAIV